MRVEIEMRGGRRRLASPRDARILCALGKARLVEPEHAPGLLPVLDDLVVRRDDQDVRLTREREALDDAERGMWSIYKVFLGRSF